MTAPFISDFRSLSINFSTIFDGWVFHISLPRFLVIIHKKNSPKIFGFGNSDRKRTQRMLRFRKPLNGIQDCRENNKKALINLRRLKVP